MPLKKGKSKAAVSANIKTEMKAGMPQTQAVAVAMRAAHMPPQKKGESSSDPYGHGAAMAKAHRANVHRSKNFSSPARRSKG